MVTKVSFIVGMPLSPLFILNLRARRWEEFDQKREIRSNMKSRSSLMSTMPILHLASSIS